tara:strand:+ start:198 stop:1505 length:1308 start_codon:yes stop_codon:yes gene_type:complete
MPITSGNVEDALNDFRALMKPCFINPDSLTIRQLDLGNGIKIPPEIQAYASSTNQITDNGLTENDSTYDSTQIDKITQATYDKIQIYNSSSALTPITDYIPYNKYRLEDIRKAVDSDPSVLLIKREYLTFLIYHYIQLIILSAIAIKISTSVARDKQLYKSYIFYINNYIREVSDIDTYKPIKNYKTNIGKIQVSNNKFLEQKTYNKKIINEIEDNERHLNYLYLYIYFIITLLIVIILFCILFKNKNNYLISVLVVLILINAYFSKYVVLIEGFTTYKPDADIEVKAQEGKTSPTECSDHLNIQTVPKSEIKYKLCQALQVTYNKFENNSIDSTELIKENKLYNGLYNKAKNINLNTKDKINIDTFSFYRRKAYTNLFMRIVILGILLLILYNIFGYNYIIVILGIVLFCLILMVYFYTLKHMSRTNYRTKNWI